MTNGSWTRFRRLVAESEGSWLPRACLVILMSSATSAERVSVWSDTFDDSRLDPGRWTVTADGDFGAKVVDVEQVTPGRSGRLRLGAETLNTRDETIKILGVRSIPAIQLAGEVRISVDLDWNKQTNGSYLSAAIVLSPHATSTNPFALPDWLKIEYVGVPPGQNARMVVAVKRQGQERTLHNEGWPNRNRAGRRVALQHLVIVVRDQGLQVFENDRLVYQSEGKVVDPRAAHLYLQMSSHSNYPRRTVYFDDVHVDEERSSDPVPR
jgi:hypothetical protein